MKNLRFFLNLCPSGEGLSYMVKRILFTGFSACGGSRQRHASPPPQCDNYFVPYGKVEGLSHMVQNKSAEKRYFPISLRIFLLHCFCRRFYLLHLFHLFYSFCLPNIHVIKSICLLLSASETCTGCQARHFITY